MAELDGSGNLVARFVFGSKGQIPDEIVRGASTYRVISDQIAALIGLESVAA